MSKKKNMTREQLNNYYYNPNDLFSYNATISMIMGERSAGKSFALKRKLLDDYLEKGRTAVYVRRQQVQIENACKTLFDDVINSEEKYQKHEYNLLGAGNRMEYQVDGKPFCILLSLSAYNKYKGVYFDTYNLFFDEFIEETGKFLKDEEQAFYSLISTIFRDRQDFRIYLASNSVTYYCWLFDEFKIQPDGSKRFYTYSRGKNEKGQKVYDFVLEVSQGNSERTEDVKNSRLGRLYMNAGLGDYMIENNALMDNNEHILPNKPLGCDLFVCGIKYGSKICGIWTDNFNTYYYVDNKIDNQALYNRKVYIFEEDKKEGWISVKKARDFYYTKCIKDSYYQGDIMFKDNGLKNDFINFIIKYL